VPDSRFLFSRKYYSCKISNFGGSRYKDIQNSKSGKKILDVIQISGIILTILTQTQYTYSVFNGCCSLS